MSPDYLALTCPSCGATLDVYPDMEQFTCGSCGTTVAARRRGGTIALKAVEDAIRRLQVGTDKTAAELALPRLDSELEAAKVTRGRLAAQGGAPGCALGCCAFVLCLIVGVVWAFSLSNAAAGAFIILLTLVGSFVVAFLVAGVAIAATPADLTAIDGRIAGLQDQIRRAREIANS